MKNKSCWCAATATDRCNLWVHSMIYYTYSMTTCRVLEMASPDGIHTICSSVGMKLINGLTLITIHFNRGHFLFTLSFFFYLSVSITTFAQPFNHTNKRHQTIAWDSVDSFPSITPKFLSMRSRKISLSGTSFSPQKQRRRERCLIHSVDEGDYQSHSWLFHWSQAAKNSGGEYRRAVNVFFQGGGEGLFELGVNAVKMVELAYLHPGSAQGDYMQRFYVTHLTASFHGGFEGSPSLAGLGPHLTQLWVYKDNGCQTSRPLTNNKGEGNNQSGPAPSCQTWVKSHPKKKEKKKKWRLHDNWRAPNGSKWI